MKFLHISDLHMGAHPQDNVGICTRLSLISNDDSYAQHKIIVTGDIIDNEGVRLFGGRQKVPVSPTDLLLAPPNSPAPPTDAAHYAIAERALMNARDALLPFKGRIYLCPGNHDYALWGNVFDSRYADMFDKYLTVPLEQNRTVPPSSGFAGVNSLPYYQMMTEGTVSVELIALNSCRQSALGLADGLVGGTQINSLQQRYFAENAFPPESQPRLFMGVVRIAILHHHPWFHVDALKLVNADQVLGTLRTHVDLLLFGHRHVFQRWTAQQVPGGGFRFGAIAAGSLRDPHATVSEIDIRDVNTCTVRQVNLPMWQT